MPKTVSEAARELLAGAVKASKHGLVEWEDVEILRAALAAEQGMVSVPRELTKAQRRAIIQACEDHVALFPHDGILRADRIYNAMLAAHEKDPTDGR